MPPTSDARRSETLGETIPTAVTASIAARPDAEAVVLPGRRVTYRELGELVGTPTRAMVAVGVASPRQARARGAGPTGRCPPTNAAGKVLKGELRARAAADLGRT